MSFFSSVAWAFADPSSPSPLFFPFLGGLPHSSPVPRSFSSVVCLPLTFLHWLQHAVFQQRFLAGFSGVLGCLVRRTPVLNYALRAAFPQFFSVTCSGSRSVLPSFSFFARARLNIALRSCPCFGPKRPVCFWWTPGFDEKAPAPLLGAPALILFLFS